MSLAGPLHRPFADETIHLVRGVLGASRLVYYKVDREHNLGDFVLEEVPPDCHRQYVREMFAFDPLHVRKVAEHGAAVVRLADAARHAPSDHIRWYANFLRHFEVVDVLELIFRDDRNVVAGLNVT
jgi:hypothetical protein